MLIDGTYIMINQIIFNLNFDDVDKSIVMKTDDIVGITYKKDGEKFYIKGRVAEIRSVPNPNAPKSTVYIKIDGSEEYYGRDAVIIPENVLDIVLFETSGVIVNPVLSVNDKSKRIILLMENEDGQLLYSKDGITWGTPARGLQGISAYEVAVENGFIGTEEEWLISLIGKDGTNGISAYEVAVSNGFIGTETEWLASLKGENGIDGKSAYQIAVMSGFIGTEEEWLASLKGEKGADGVVGIDGKSAYEIAVDNGFVGTEQEWLVSLNGKNGTNGIDGKSAYQIAVINGFTGTETEWLVSLKGEDGNEGPKGDDGSNGDTGKSAYQVAVENGFVGTEEEWLASLKGEKGPSGGDPGKSAYEIAVDNGFAGTEQEWLVSLNGKNGQNGEDGNSAYQVAIENGFIGTEEEWLVFIKGAPGDRGQKGEQGQKGDTPYIDDETGRWFIAGKDTGKVAVPDITEFPEVPTALSQLINDEGFIKNTVDNLINYYAKNDIYTKQEINNMVGGLSTVKLAVVSELPTENISTNTIYLIDIGNGVFSQHIYINGEWASFGDTSVNLDNYVTKAALQIALDSKAEKNHTHAELHTHPNKPVLDTITAESVTKWNNGFSGKYNDLTGAPDIPTVTNDLTNELKDSYDQAVEKMHTHTNKSVIDKFTESATGNVLYDGKEISTGGGTGANIDDADVSLKKTWSSKKISDDISIVSDKATHAADIANNINIAQKTVNSVLDYAQAKLSSSYTPVINEYVPFKSTIGNINVENGKFKIESGKTYEITIILGYINAAQTIYSNVLYGLYIDNNKKIGSLIPQYGQPKYELPFMCNTIYTNETDAVQECGLMTETIYTNSKLDNNSCTMSIKEISRDIVIDPVNYINTTQGIEDTPVGHILSVMGKTAPKHYLSCDGTVYNIADYLYLSQYIKDQFGTFNFFGGDGIVTFAVPDLRDEFLRGYHGEKIEQRSGEIGSHQDATISPYIVSLSSGGAMYTGYNSSDIKAMVRNTDKAYENPDTNKKSQNITTALQNVTDQRWYGYESRPTNVAVLYCIKYEPTYFMNVRGLLEEKVLWSGSSIFKCVNNAYNNINTDISLIDSILNYDEVRFAYSWYRSTDKQTQNHEQKVFIVKDIVLNKSILLNIVSSFNMICELSFITGNLIRVSRTYSKDLNQTSGDSIELTNVTCVKYKTEQSQGGGNCDCPTYTNDEIREYLEGIYNGN